MGQLIKLCCGGKGCATIEQKDDNVHITDEGGSVVVLTNEEANLISGALKQLQKQDD